jgi:hypothetical protein
MATESAARTAASEVMSAYRSVEDMGRQVLRRPFQFGHARVSRGGNR